MQSQKSYCLSTISLVLCFNLLLLNGCNSQSWDTGASDTPCTTPMGNPGACQPLVMCPSLYDLVKTRPIPAEVTNLLRNSQCGFIDTQPKVCCPTGGSSVNAPQPFDDSPELSPVVPQQNYLIPNTSVCGEAIISRIFGGMETDIDEFPWTALLEYTRPNGKGFYCGGVLISSRYVLTAAHCVNGGAIPPTWKLTGVRLGEWNTKTDPDCTADNEVCADPPVDVPIESTVVHSQYGTNNKSKLNDIALLRLATPVTFTYWVKPVCLPIYDQRLLNKDFVGDDLYAVGWGATEIKSVSDVKLKVRIRVVPQSSCTPIYATAGVVVGRHQMCAGGQKGKDTCRGDSGGPLMFEDLVDGQASWYVAGITNVGSTPCGTQGWPGVYTKVTSYTKWIAANIKP